MDEADLTENPYQIWCGADNMDTRYSCAYRVWISLEPCETKKELIPDACIQEATLFFSASVSLSKFFQNTEPPREHFPFGTIIKPKNTDRCIKLRLYWIVKEGTQSEKSLWWADFSLARFASKRRKPWNRIGEIAFANFSLRVFAQSASIWR